MADNKYPPSYGQEGAVPKQPSQAHLDPRNNQQAFSPSPGPHNQVGAPWMHQQYSGPPQAYGPEGYYGGGDRGMQYGPPPPAGGYYQQGPYPPHGYQQGPYPPQGYQQGSYYPPQNGYYERKQDRDSNCCAIFFGSLAACCCLDLLFF